MPICARLVAFIMLIGLLLGCAPGSSAPSSSASVPAAPNTQRAPAPTVAATVTSTLPESIVLYDWPDDIPTAILEAFTREYKVRIEYVTYDSQEEAIANLEKGANYDVVILENQYVPVLADKSLLAEVNYQNIPRAKNIMANFRNRSFDPENKYAVPMNWGTTGIIARKDLVKDPLTSWNDLWSDRYRGKVALTVTERDLIGVTLKALGYSVNSEDPKAIQAVRQRLLTIAPNMIPVQDEDEAADVLADGRAVIAMSYAGTALKLQDRKIDINYILPKEGTIIWGDNFVIPAASPNRRAAELFIDYMLRPDVSAQLVQANHYATPNEAAIPLLPIALQLNPIMFPPGASLLNSESILPLSAQGEQLYVQVWSEFNK